MGEWMDRWMDGWVDEWMDGGVSGWMDGWMGGCSQLPLLFCFVQQPDWLRGAALSSV